MVHPAMGAPYNDCSWNVSQRNAPGAIKAMALMVSPVNPRVALVVGLFAPPGGVGPFVILVCEFGFYFAGLFCFCVFPIWPDFPFLPCECGSRFQRN